MWQKSLCFTLPLHSHICEFPSLRQSHTLTLHSSSVPFIYFLSLSLCLYLFLMQAHTHTHARMHAHNLSLSLSHTQTLDFGQSLAASLVPVETHPLSHSTLFVYLKLEVKNIPTICGTNFSSLLLLYLHTVFALIFDVAHYASYANDGIGVTGLKSFGKCPPPIPECTRNSSAYAWFGNEIQHWTLTSRLL